VLTKYCPKEDHHRRNATLAWAVIELDNLIISLARQFLVSSLMRCRTTSGSRVQHSGPLMSQLDAAFFVMSVLEPKKYSKLSGSPLARRDETTIRDPNKIMQVAVAANLSNAPSILTALSFPTKVFSEISSVRHFFAHRNEETAAQAVAFALGRGLLPPMQPWEIVGLLVPGQPYSMLDEWIYDLGQFQELLTT
jgi:hypothetical protein